MIFVALIGVTLIIVRGTIFRRLQQFWPALFRCAQCTGFWVGVAASAGKLVTTGQQRAVDAILVGAAISVLAMAADAVFISLLGDPNSKE
jgi:hypothetical protein